jgi:hypothetical protein
LKTNRFSEEHNASIFGIEEKAKKESSTREAESATLKMEAIFSSKASDIFNYNIQSYVLCDTTLGGTR